MPTARVRPTVLDLFCGCSGLGLGAREAGFSVPLSVDFDPVLTSSHRLNFPNDKVFLSDLGSTTGDQLVEAVGGRIDGIIGGPPCQGFSSIGVSDPADPRRGLVGSFFRIVKDIQPSFFVMENVRGLMFEKNRPVLEAGLNMVADDYDILGPLEVNAADYGAPTHRRRIFVIGYKAQTVNKLSSDDLLAAKQPINNVEQAISDLANTVEVEADGGFDQWKYGNHSALSSYAMRMRSDTGLTTGHRKITHRQDVVARFALVKPGATDKVGRYPRLSLDGLSPTIRAGTGADKGSYQAVRPIHPTEPRVITVREAARLQGFPDWFRFHPTIWHSFRMIGNSVSPIVSKVLLDAIFRRISSQQEVM